ncbi:hydrogenase expression/formation protein HypE [Paradesulfitobacterium aromaticivorans]
MAERILLAHGDGGILTHTLIQELFHKYFTSAELAALSDAAILPFPAPDAEVFPNENSYIAPTNLLAMTTDSFVVNPLIFPGGDIGKLAIAGTVNDLAVSGAKPLYLSAAFILEEGLDLSLLERIVASMAAAARAAHVKIITGDTKVVERGRCDGMYINTTGIGMMQPGIHLGYDKIQPGDQLIINGGVGEHGVAVLAERSGLSFSTPLLSDCAALNGLIQALLARFGSSIKFMRDPTRGGLATTAKEIALSAKLDIWLKDEQIPVKNEVRGACELLGLDPLYLANEGKVMLVVEAQKAEEILSFIRDYYEVNGLVSGLNPAIIGEIRSGQGRVLLETPLGGTRLLEMLAGAPLPRIC